MLRSLYKKLGARKQVKSEVGPVSFPKALLYVCMYKFCKCFPRYHKRNDYAVLRNVNDLYAMSRTSRAAKLYQIVTT